MGGNLTNVVTCSDENTTFVISGSCNFCGKCCKSEWVTTDFMVSDSWCKFVTEEGMCFISLASIEDLDTISSNCLAYWGGNCEMFPMYLSGQNATILKANLERLGWPYEECGYTLTVIPNADGD